MKKSDLYREWARVLDMCEGTEVSPGLCWKLNGFGSEQDCIPKFNCDGGRYEFAVAVLEGKPVFVGDTLYCKGDRRGEYIVTKDGAMQNGVGYALDCLDYLSWTPQKKTFMLNGEELPCEDNTADGYVINIDAGEECDRKQYFTFINIDDRNKVADAIIKLLK